MDPNRWKQIDELVDAALDLPEGERTAFVEDKSAGDQELRKAVTQLLGAQSETNDFLQHSAMKIVAKAIAEETSVRSKETYIGRTIATYRIEKLLGAGGMGEVYLAFDEKMRRKVALKILPPEYGTEDERVRRFEMEARAISKINHPNIVTIYDVGNHEGINYIATEFVEGKTLRDLIGGKFKLRNVMANSIQICDALSAAHEQGIIHRDIKPENVMIRRDGYAKILDFGVAKLTEIGPETIRRFGNTTRGMIIGTPGYMSPSQVSGDNVDHRTDIWSCGVVLYEFLTGKNPFTGANRQATFQAILSETPPPASSLNEDIPKELDRILQKTFQKDPDYGYQTASDLRADLKLVKRELDSLTTGELHSSSSVGIRRQKSSKMPYFVAAAACVLLASLLGIYFLFLRNYGQMRGPDWANATKTPLTNQVGIEYFPSLSPDGKDIVYAGQENGQLDIMILRVGAKKATNLTPNSPDDDDTQPVFSPNGDLIAFRSEREAGGIYTVEPSGDNLRKVSDFGFHPSFSPDGKQLVVSSWGRDQPTVRAAPDMSLQIIDVSSGARRELIRSEATFPAWSPNGHRIAYWFYTGTFGRRDIATIPAGGGEPVIVAKDFAVSNWNPVWSPDGNFLYFVSSKSGSMNFWRVAIDEKTGVVSGEPEPVVTPSSYSRHLTFSRDGKRLAYVQSRNTSNIRGIDFDLAAMKTIGDPYWITKGEREIARPELSPDGSRFVLRLIKATQDDIATVSRDGTDWRDVTNDEPFDRYVRWAPDGKRLAYNSDRNGGGQVWVSNADGSATKQMTFEKGAASTGFPIWSPDGTKLAVYHRDLGCYFIDPNTGERIMTLPAIPDSEGLVPWDWSRDGSKIAGVIAEKRNRRTIAYYSFETGTYEPLAEIPFTIPVQWTPDGKYIIWSLNRTVKAVDIKTKKVTEIYKSTDFDVVSPFVSADGKMLYFGAGDYQSDIWLLDLPDKP